MKSYIQLSIIASILCSTPSFAQELPAIVRVEDRATLNKQSEDLYKILDPIAAKFAPSVVQIKAGRTTLAMGTVTELGIITKLSEINIRGVQLRMIDHQGNILPVKLKSTNKEYDLALLENTSNLPSLEVKPAKELPIGSIILAPGAAKEVFASGVVSVTSRSLKEEDRGFLGVILSPVKVPNGVMLDKVEDRTAASRAGIQAGDILTKVNDTEVTNLLQLRNILQQQAPGSLILVDLIRDQKLLADVKVTLGGRKQLPRIERSRMNTMKRLGGSINEVAEGFPEVIQSDMQLESHLCGLPIIDLEQNFIGIAIARSSRIKTYILEAEKLKDLFK